MIRTEQLRFICNDRVDFSPVHLHQHLVMLNPRQCWIFKRLASILLNRLPHVMKTSFSLQRLTPRKRQRGTCIPWNWDISQTKIKWKEIVLMLFYRNQSWMVEFMIQYRTIGSFTEIHRCKWAPRETLPKRSALYWYYPFDKVNTVICVQHSHLKAIPGKIMISESTKPRRECM